MIELLATVGSADIAATAGFLTQAAVRRTPVLLDGVVSGAAALVAARVSYRVGRWLLAGHRSTEPAHHAALARLGLEPLVDYGMRLGEGTGALHRRAGAQGGGRAARGDVDARRGARCRWR